ncbi:hypothetical protein CALCODRAFT_482486 [Calocera cornea HHB12733]|uniref:Uncharacterized protein n=1 Tax=Calocera cornea HHB12733 TaxID=1353952 RepID=A0A165GLK2_9BASI|nr:hypothetical protein CALCODRAFT_482486 [Calocera cornea HHB12733]
MLDLRNSYLKTLKAVTMVAEQTYDDTGISLLEFAYLALSMQRLYPALKPPGLPCRWMAHVMFHGLSALQEQPLPPAYVGRIKGVDDAQVMAVVAETRKALAAHKPRNQVDRMVDFLTGFHKRKLAKHQEKVDRAKEREKLQRLQDRADTQKMLREKAIENAKQVEAALGGEVGQDQFATVRLIEDFDPSADLYPPTAALLDGAEPSAADAPKPPRQPKPPKPPMAKTRSVAGKKDKERKFRYETKARQKTARGKEKVRRREKGGGAGPGGDKPSRGGSARGGMGKGRGGRR